MAAPRSPASFRDPSRRRVIIFLNIAFSAYSAANYKRGLNTLITSLQMRAGAIYIQFAKLLDSTSRSRDIAG